MGVFDGQPVSAAVTNPAFLDANADDTAFGIITLANAAPASGATITNIQGLMNHLANTTGATVTTDGTTYSSTTVISNGNNHQVALGKLDQRFNGTTGHTHDGTPGNGPIITSASDPNAIYRNGSQPPTANQPWATFGITNLGFISSTNTPVASSGFIRMGFGDQLRWRNTGNTADISFLNDGVGFRFHTTTFAFSSVAEGLTNGYSITSTTGVCGFANNVTVTTNSAVTSSQFAFQSWLNRVATGNVTDTQPLFGGQIIVNVNLPAINTYVNTQSINGLSIDIIRTNASPITTSFFNIINLGDTNTIPVTGRKQALSLPGTFSGGTVGTALITDSGTYTGNWATYLQVTNPNYFQGDFRIGFTTPLLGTTEKLSVYNLFTSAPAGPTIGAMHLTHLVTTAAIAQTPYATYNKVSRRSSSNVTDTAFVGVGSFQWETDCPGGVTYTNSSSINALRIEAINNVNACTLAITSYRGIRINDDAVVTGGKKIAIRVGTWSGGTANAILADSEITGNWFISQTVSTFPTQFNGSVVIATAALATNATDGFLYISSCAGTPTGVPTTRTGTNPIVWDSTNSIPYIYQGGWTPLASNGFTLTAAQIPTTITAVTYTVLGNDVFIRVNTTTNAITITLPDPSTRRRLIFVDVGGNLSTNNLTIARFAAEQIAGIAASFVYSSSGGTIQLQSDGTNWWLV